MIVVVYSTGRKAKAEREREILDQLRRFPGSCHSQLRKMKHMKLGSKPDAFQSDGNNSRKKRKWDQPAESLIAAGIVLPGVTLSMSSTGISLPGAVPLPGSFLSNPVPATLPQSGLASHNSVAITQKLNQVVDSWFLYYNWRLMFELLHLQIQKCTGAVVITRDKYKPPNGLQNESFIAAGIVLPGVTLSMSSTGISLPGAVPLPGSFLSNPVPATLPQSGLASHNSVAITQKLNQPKIQDELIAREIVINDAEPTIRYKLTKRQTQEEIQKCSAVVISRGKYKPPNGLPDNEKPLYLHISAGAQVAAIKQLNRDGLQGCKEYLVEVLMLIMLQHPNLVTLIGYCAEGDERLLVYEYMAKGSLEDHLFANEKLTHLPAKFPRMEPISLRSELSKLHHVYEPTKNEGTAPANAALPLACPQQGDGSFITGVIANNMDKKCHQQQHSSSSQVIPVHSSPLRTKIASHDKTDPRERFMSIP